MSYSKINKKIIKEKSNVSLYQFRKNRQTNTKVYESRWLLCSRYSDLSRTLSYLFHCKLDDLVVTQMNYYVIKETICQYSLGDC